MFQGNTRVMYLLYHMLYYCSQSAKCHSYCALVLPSIFPLWLSHYNKDLQHLDTDFPVCLAFCPHTAYHLIPILLCDIMNNRTSTSFDLMTVFNSIPTRHDHTPKWLWLNPRSLIHIIILFCKFCVFVKWFTNFCM